MAGLLQVGAVVVRGGDVARHPVHRDAQDDGFVGLRRVVGPTMDAGRLGAVDLAEQRARRRGGAGGQAGAQRCQRLAVLDPRGAVAGGGAAGVRVERAVLRSVVEHAAAAIVDEAFGRGALGQDDVVAVEFDVDVVDPVPAALLGDGVAVDQAAGGHQHAVDEHGVLGRDQQVAVRQPAAERAGAEADRLDGGIGGQEAPGVAAAADPADRAMRAGGGDEGVADGEAVDRALALRGGDQGARAVTGDRRRTEVG